MKTKNLLTLLVTAFALSGCAHSVMRGSVAMKTSPDEAHVCLGKGEVKAGDRVNVFKNVCTGMGLKTRINTLAAPCEKKQMGMGTVKEIINSHYSVVKFDSGVQFEEGTLVEKN